MQASSPPVDADETHLRESGFRSHLEFFVASASELARNTMVNPARRINRIVVHEVLAALARHWRA
jgi:hypothetical protein